MESIIFRYLDKDREELVGVTSYEYYKKKMQTAKQLICVVGWRHTKEQWEEMKSLDEQQLYEVLS